MSGRVVRIFLSSTFRDFGEERDLLVRRLFPTLRARLQSRFVDLIDVDLRWGITAEEAERGDVLPICLSEIDRARPFFIGFLGERYGWVPPKDAYPSHVLETQSWLEEHRGGKSVTELEIMHGVLNNPHMAGRALFYFRSFEYSSSKGGDYVAASADDEIRQKALKTTIRESGFPVHEDYKTPAHLAELLEQDLWEILNREFPASDIPDAFERENLQHEAYALPRQRLYIGGDQYLAALDRALSENKQWILIDGPSGGGKSALLANWLKSVSDREENIEVHAHYLGATADATDPIFLVRRLIECIQRMTESTDDLASDPDELLDSLPIWLANASAWCEMQGKKFLFVIDALNGLSDRRDLRWFPRMLPKHIHLVISTLPGEVNNALLDKADWSRVSVIPLDAKTAELVFTSYLSLFNKTLPDSLVVQVMAHELAVNPLFLLTLAEELRLFGEHEQLSHRLDHYLTSITVDDLFERVLERIEQDFGAKMLREIMTALWAARAGLREEEILGYLGLKPMHWAYIRNALGPTLIDASGRLIFAHDYMCIAVSDRYMAGNNTIGQEGQSEEALNLRRTAHKKLSKWFGQYAFKDGQSIVSDERAAEEIPYQWQQAQDWKKLQTFLNSTSGFMSLIKYRSKSETLLYWRHVENNTSTRLKTYGKYLAQKWYHADPNKTGALILLAWIEFLFYASRYKPALGSTIFLTRLEKYLSKDELERAKLSKSDILISISEYDKGVSLLNELLETRLRKSGERHPDTAKLLNRLVAADYARGSFGSAKATALQALSIQEKNLGIAHGETLQTLNNLANIDIELSLFKDAINRHQLVGENYKKRNGEYSVEYAQSLNNLGRAYEGEAAYEEAAHCYKKSIKIYQEVLGDYSTDILKPISNLGLLLFNFFNKTEEAKDYQTHALAIAESIFPDDHPEIARLLANLSVTETDFAKKKAYVIRANDICKKKLENHPYTSASFTLLATIYSEERNFEGAFHCFEQAIEISKASTGKLSKSYADALRSMGDFLYRNEKSSIAVNYLEKAIQVYDEILQPNDPHRSDVLCLIAFTLSENGEHQEALIYYKETLKIIEKVFPGDLGRLILPLQYLAETYLRLGDYNMAEPLYKRALEAQNLLQGAYHPDLAQTCFDIADIYLELSHYKVAEEYYRKTLAIEELNLGPDHEDIALTYYNLGKTLAKQTIYLEAEQYFQKTLQIELRELGEYDPEIALTFLSIGECQFHQAKFDDAELNLQKAYTLQLIEYDEKGKNLGRVLRLLYETFNALGKLEQAQKTMLKLDDLNK